MAADPRECGGNPPVTRRNIAGKGPSPRVRGKRPSVPPARRTSGSIPASAGETIRSIATRARCSVHPRECGGNTRPAPVAPYSPGPSPRVRGKHCSIVTVSTGGGSIPASAGETSRRSASDSVGGVHPRECGGNNVEHDQRSQVRGPSPRVRGKRRGTRCWVVPQGSIPASAGETGMPWALRRRWRVHPRECGGNRIETRTSRSIAGPSPRVRGKLGGPGIDERTMGSIPASAGETGSRPGRRAPSPVHPRECGGNSAGRA